MSTWLALAEMVGAGVRRHRSRAGIELPGGDEATIYVFTGP